MKHDRFQVYDFEKDEWVEPALIHAVWSSKELPAPSTKPDVGKWHGKPGRLTFRDWLRILLQPRFESRTSAIIALSCLMTIVFGAALVNAFVFGLGFCGMIGLLAYLVIIGLRPEISPASDKDLCLLEDPTDIDLCLVEITIWRREQPVGKDRGLVWFGEGRLLFSGRRTSFAVGGEDVLPLSQWPKTIRKFGFDDYLPLRADLGSAGILFEVVPLGHTSHAHADRFTERLRAFRQRPPQSRGTRQWPPFERD